VKRDVAKAAHDYPRTPDGRYFVVRGRLWRLSNPRLSASKRAEYVMSLMAARRAIKTARQAEDFAAQELAHEAVDQAKLALGERGPVWWDDGAPDYNRHMARNTPYANWFAGLG
jgi:hypothetical protein